jgi:hypothetical protein
MKRSSRGSGSEWKKAKSGEGVILCRQDGQVFLSAQIGFREQSFVSRCVVISWLLGGAKSELVVHEEREMVEERTNGGLQMRTRRPVVSASGGST